jgi:hypothetical protein
LDKGITKAQGFRIFKTKYRASSNEFDRIKEVLSENGETIKLKHGIYYNIVYTEELAPEVLNTSDEASKLSLQQYQNSFIYFRNPLKLDGNGILLNPQDMIEFGYWSEYERAAYLIPQDYFPEDYLRQLEEKESKQTPVKNGFILSDLLIPSDQIMSGGPPKDGIPALDRPKFEPIVQSDFGENSRVIGIVNDGLAKAYPIGILNWHEIVNDEIGDLDIVVTYCPLCGSGIIFSSRFDEQIKSFGVSGLLFNSDVLLYDRETLSLWSQLESKAISGTSSGTHLEIMKSTTTTLGNWKAKYPNSLIMSRETGYARDYNRDPYKGYDQSDQLYFPVANSNKTMPSKSLVLGVKANDQFKAYPLSAFSDTKGKIQDTLGGIDIEITYDKTAQSATITSASKDVVKDVLLYWFAWYAFHPDTEIYGK